MRTLFLSAALFLAACGGAGEPAAPVETFVLGEPQYKKPNVKQTTRAYKEAFKLAEDYLDRPEKASDNIGVTDVLTDRQQALQSAEDKLRAPLDAKKRKQVKEDRERYFKGIRSVAVDECVWSRMSDGAQGNYLYNAHGLDAQRGWACKSKVTLKFCARCDQEEVHGIMLFVKRDEAWLFVGARELEGEKPGCAYKNFLGTNSMENNGLKCVEPVGAPWPPAGS